MNTHLNLDCQLLENQLCHRFYKISNAITRAYRPMLEKLGLTYPQYIVMMALWEQDQLTISELHLRTQIDIGSLSLMLKKMATKEIISLVTSDIDRRVKTVHLTKVGQDLKTTTQQAKQELPANNPLSKKEIQTLISILDKLKPEQD